MHTYDFSPGTSTLQSIFFAAWSACQLIVSNLAFHRGGFVYGLGVLVFGIAAFSAAVFVAHRSNRQRISVGDIGIAIERGPSHAPVLAWNKIARIRRGQQSIALVLHEGDPLQIFYMEWDEKKKNEYFATLWEDVETRANEKNIAIEKDELDA